MSNGVKPNNSDLETVKTAYTSEAGWTRRGKKLVDCTEHGIQPVVRACKHMFELELLYLEGEHGSYCFECYAMIVASQEMSHPCDVLPPCKDEEDFDNRHDECKRASDFLRWFVVEQALWACGECVEQAKKRGRMVDGSVAEYAEDREREFPFDGK